MKHIFWIIFALEALMLLWSFRIEMMLNLPMPPYIPMGFIWLLLVLIVKFIIKSDRIALAMVAIPGALRIWIAGIIMGHFVLETLMSSYSQQGPGIGMGYLAGMLLLFIILVAGSIVVKLVH